MAGAVNKDHESYNHFNDGVNSKNPPLTTIDKKILNFAVRSAGQPAMKTHGQILRNFGMHPPEFWTKAQNLSQHPALSKRKRAVLSEIFPDPSKPGPMTGGTNY